MISADNVKTGKHLRLFCSSIANIMIAMYPFHDVICFVLDVLENKVCIAFKGSKSIDINPKLNAETVFFVLCVCNQDAVKSFQNIAACFWTVNTVVLVEQSLVGESCSYCQIAIVI